MTLFTWKIIMATTDLLLCRYASVHSTDTIFRVIIQYWYTSKEVVSFKPLHENQLTGLTSSLKTWLITRKWYIEVLIVVLGVVTVYNLVGHILPPSSWWLHWGCGGDSVPPCGSEWPPSLSPCLYNLTASLPHSLLLWRWRKSVHPKH
jgi:hypothetical protein